MKRQAQIAMDKANKSCGFMKQISTLEDKVSGLMAKIVHLEECDSFLVGIVESICEMLRCKVHCSFSLFPSIPLLLADAFFVVSGTCLDFVSEARQVSERIAALERASEESTVCGLIPDVVVPLCFFKIVLSTLEKQLMVVKDL
jgi:hypothetical protein